MVSSKQLYLELRKKLDHMGYHMPFSMEAVPLVDRLSTDMLVALNESKSLKEKMEGFSAYKKKVDDCIEPYKLDNGRLLNENNQLRRTLTDQNFQHEKKIKELNSQVNHLECQLNDAKFVAKKYLERINQYEQCSINMANRLLRYEEPEAHITVKRPGRKLICKQRMDITSFLQREDDPGSRKNSASQPNANALDDVFQFTSKRCEELQQQLREYQARDEYEEKITANLKEQLALRDAEISRLHELCHQGKSLTTIGRDVIKTVNEREVEQLKIQVELLQNRNDELEKRLLLQQTPKKAPKVLDTNNNATPLVKAPPTEAVVNPKDCPNCAALQNELRERKAEVCNMNKLVREVDSAKDSLQSAVDNYSQYQRTMTRNLEDACAQLNETRTQLNSITESVDNIYRKTCGGNAVTTEAQLRRLEDLIYNLKADRDAFFHEAEKARSLNEDLERDRRKVEKALVEKEGQVSSFTAELNDARAVVARLTERSDIMQRDYNNLNLEFKKLQASQEKLSAEYQNTLDMSEQMCSQLEACQADLRLSREHMATVDKNQFEKDEKMKSLAAELDNMEKLVKELRDQMLSVKAEKERLACSMSAEHELAEALRKELEELTRQLSTLRRRADDVDCCNVKLGYENNLLRNKLREECENSAKLSQILNQSTVIGACRCVDNRPQNYNNNNSSDTQQSKMPEPLFAKPTRGDSNLGPPSPGSCGSAVRWS